jgi:hypothetical protein
MGRCHQRRVSLAEKVKGVHDYEAELGSWVEYVLGEIEEAAA